MKKAISMVLAVALMFSLAACGGNKIKRAEEVANLLKGTWGRQIPVGGTERITFSDISGNAGAIKYEAKYTAGNYICETGTFGVSINNDYEIEVVCMADVDKNGKVTKKDKPKNEVYTYTYENGKVTKINIGSVEYLKLN